jgi:hypothetical protein
MKIMLASSKCYVDWQKEVAILQVLKPKVNDRA